MVFFRTWFDKGVQTLKDLLDSNLDFLTYEEFKLWYQLRTNFLTYYGLINTIPQEYKKAIKRTSVQQEYSILHNHGYDGPGGSQSRFNFHSPVLKYLSSVLNFHSPVLIFAQSSFNFSQSSFNFYSPVLFLHSPVLIFHSPVLFFHSPVLIFLSPVLNFAQSSFNFSQSSFKFCTVQF